MPFTSAMKKIVLVLASAPALACSGGDADATIDSQTLPASGATATEAAAETCAPPAPPDRVAQACASQNQYWDRFRDRSIVLSQSGFSADRCTYSGPVSIREGTPENGSYLSPAVSGDLVFDVYGNVDFMSFEGDDLFHHMKGAGLLCRSHRCER